MKARRTEDVDREYRTTTEAVRRAFDKQVSLLIEQGPHYRSLRVHPWPADGPDAMQAYINKWARFYYYVDGDTYVIYRIRSKHPKSTQRGR